MADHNPLLLCCYAHRGPLRWLHLESTADDSRALTSGHIDVAPPGAAYTLLICAAASTDIRPYLCAWELYGTAPDQVPFAQLGAFGAAWPRLHVTYTVRRHENRRVVYWDGTTPQVAGRKPKRPRGRPRKNAQGPPHTEW